MLFSCVNDSDNMSWIPSILNSPETVSKVALLSDLIDGNPSLLREPLMVLIPSNRISPVADFSITISPLTIEQLPLSLAASSCDVIFVAPHDVCAETSPIPTHQLVNNLTQS